MGRQRGQTTTEIRKLVIYHYERGETVRKIGEIVNRSHSTVNDIIKRYREEDRIENKGKNNHPKIFNEADERWFIRKIKQNPKLSAPKLAEEAEKYLNKKAHPETIRIILRKHQYHGRIARRKPLLSAINITRRINFAKQYLKKDFSYWKTIIFADESKFNLFGSDGKVCVWRKGNQELRKENLSATVKHGGGSVTVWGCMGASGVGKLHLINGIMDQYVYLNILKSHLKESAEKLGIGDCFSYYQDNDPKHKAHDVRLWLLYNCAHVLETPAQSPDLNVIENLWDHLDRKIRKRHISNIKELKKALLEEWENIEPSYCTKLVQSMPRRLTAVLSNKGLSTKYYILIIFIHNNGFLK